LPDGALKRQLLGEIAELVQLAARELTELWLGRHSEPAQTNLQNRYKKSSYSRNNEVRLRPEFTGI
jgi:DNA primase